MSKRQEKKEQNLLPNTQPLQSAQSSNQDISYHQGQQPVTMDPPILPSTSRKRNRVSGGNTSASASVGGGSGGGASASSMSHPSVGGSGGQRIGIAGSSTQGGFGSEVAESSMPSSQQPPVKKSRTNTPWTPLEEQRLKSMRDAQNSWAEIAKTFPTRTEGSVKKHWYKSAALLNAIKEYETNKWKVIGQKVGKPAKACEQYAKEHFTGRM